VDYFQPVNHRHGANYFVRAYWRVSLCRFVEGYPVMDDRVHLRIDEKTGLVGYSDVCVTDVEGVDLKPRLDKDTAVKKGISHARSVKTVYNGFDLSEEPSVAELWIVRPNDMATCTGLDLKFEKRGRLAWGLIFRLTDPLRKLHPGSLTIYIDAVNGRFLGGVF